MKTYKDLGGDSGVAAYDYGSDWIQIEFKTGSIYEYTNASAGQGNIESMKKFANSGDGLNSFINKNVRKLYSKKIG